MWYCLLCNDANHKISIYPLIMWTTTGTFLISTFSHYNATRLDPDTATFNMDRWNGKCWLDHTVVLVEHFTAEQGSRGQQRARQTGTIKLRAAKADLVSCANMVSDTSQCVPWVPPHLCGHGWGRACVGQSSPSSHQCGDGISAQSGHAQPSPSLADPQHWAEQLGGSEPTGYSKTDRFSMS